MTGPSVDWSDERLAAAFAARAADRPVPPRVVESTLERVRSVPRDRTLVRPLAWAGALVAVLTIAVVVGTGVVSRLPDEPPASLGASDPGPVVGTPTAAPSPSATVGTITLDLVDVGGRRLTVEVVDQSGRLRSAAAMAGGLPGDVPAPQTVAATPVEGEPNQVRIVWVGGVCDAVTRFTIRPDGRTIDMATEARPGDTPCILIGIFRGIVLTFDRPVEVADVEIVERSPEEPAPSSSIDAAFPTQALGLPVLSVSEALARLRGDVQDTELAVRGWYVAPDPSGECPDLQDERGPLEQPCPEAAHWLLETPERMSTNPARGWIEHPPRGPYVNPIVPADAPFDVPNLWFDVGPIPLPVVVLGHFADARGQFGARPEDLVVDALVWRAGAAAADDPWTLAAPAERPASVTARIDRDLGDASATWLSVVAGIDLDALDPNAAPLSPELISSRAVWVARRLITTDDGRPRMARAYTADGGDRVWYSELCCTAWLETTIDVELAPGVVVEIVDNPAEVIAVRRGELAGAASWITGDGPADTGAISLGVDEARPNELRIAWRGECDRVWRLEWSLGSELLLWPREQVPACRLGGVRREVVLTFDHPVNLETIVVSNGGSGG